MDFTILATFYIEGDLDAFDRALRLFMEAWNWKEGFPFKTGTPEEALSREIIIQRYDQASDEFADALVSFLGRALLFHQPCSITTSSVRTVGFGEDGPRFSHENGYFTDNEPGRG